MNDKIEEEAKALLKKYGIEGPNLAHEAERVRLINETDEQLYTLQMMVGDQPFKSRLITHPKLMEYDIGAAFPALFKAYSEMLPSSLIKEVLSMRVSMYDRKDLKK